MGKKKKTKSKLLNEDYTNISSEDQFRLLELGERLMRGENVGLFGTGDKKPVPKKKLVVKEEREEDIFSGYNQSSVSAKSLVNSLIKTQMGVTVVEDAEEEEDEFDYEDKTLEDYVQDLHECTAVIKNKEVSEDVSSDRESIHRDEAQSPSVSDGEIDRDFEYELEENEEEATLDNQFKVLTEDMETSDIVINDAWKRYKSHSISFFNMRAATMDYENSSLYAEMCGFLDFAIAVIAGPVLIVREGNPKFQRFIDQVESCDTERIFFVTKTDEEILNPNGKPATHILMYYIDKKSKELLNILVEGWEDNGDNEIVLDFVYSIYKKVTDRYENPFSVYAGIDVLIENFESSDTDIDYVIDLILKEESTVVRTDNGGSHYEHFLKNIVMNRIEAFINCPQNPMGIFEIFKNILSIYFEKDNDGGILQIPTNFGLDEETSMGGPHIPVDVPDEIILEESQEDSPKSTTIIEEFAYAEVVDETNVDDVDDESEINLDEFIPNEVQKDSVGSIMNDLSTVLHVDYTQQPELSPESMMVEIPVKKEDVNSDVKKFGSKPYDGGSMIITV